MQMKIIVALMIGKNLKNNSTLCQEERKKKLKAL